MFLLFYYLFIFIFGLIIGSFLNCVIYRLGKEVPTARLSKIIDFIGKKLIGRSYCPNCKNILSWIDLIPVISFLFLKGKCRYCQKRISIQYPFVEIATGLIFLLIFQFSLPAGRQEFSNLINLFFLFYIASSMIVIFVYDLKHFIIPDNILLPAIAIAFLYRFLSSFQIAFDFINYIFAAIIASGFFLIIFLISKGKWMGFGDVKLAILLGLILGFPSIIVGIFLAFFFGAIIGMGAILLNKKGLKSEIPFAPFLISGMFTAMFWGDAIVQWYTTRIFNL